MNNKLFIQYVRCIIPCILLITLFSCKNSFDIQPKDVLDEQDAYRNVHDADAVVIGIYGKLMNVADRYVVLNELRGDLMDVTTNANQYLKQLNVHNVTTDNTYADPRPFYDIIINCNDALQHFNQMLKDNRLTTMEYSVRYSTVGAIRSWIYLELGIQYGNIPYVTSPIADVNALKNENNFPRLSFDQLLDSLIRFTESLPYKTPFPDASSLLTSVDGYSTNKFFIPVKCLLGDLYLWKGNYTQAAVNYHYMLNLSDLLYPAMNSEQWYETYKIAWQLNGTDWYNIFSQPYGERYSNYEIIWDLPFDENFNPTNPFINLFYTTSSGGYLLKPSQLAINNWKDQTRTDNTPGDIRGKGVSWKMVGLEPVINKYISNYNPLSPFETNGKWILYRAAELHLRYAEAANRDGRSLLAYGLLNWGLKYSFDPEHLGTSHDSRDVTDIEQSFGPSYYYFDARMGDFPRFRGPWYRNVGIRGRVGLPLIPIDSAKYYNMNAYPREFLNTAVKDSLEVFIENKLIHESALGLAFEGHRWPDLLRIALRRNKLQPGSGTAFLQAKIAAKFIAAGEPGKAATVRAKLADPKNWYLPFDWK